MNNLYDAEILKVPHAVCLWKFWQNSPGIVFLNWYKFLTRALSSLLNGQLCCRYIFTALKLIIYNNVVSFYLQYKHKKCV